MNRSKSFPERKTGVKANQIPNFLILWCEELLAKSVWWYKPGFSQRSRFIYSNCHVSLCVVGNQWFLELYSLKEYCETLILLLQTIQKLLIETDRKTVNIDWILKLVEVSERITMIFQSYFSIVLVVTHYQKLFTCHFCWQGDDRKYVI